MNQVSSSISWMPEVLASSLSLDADSCLGHIRLAVKWLRLCNRQLADGPRATAHSVSVRSKSTLKNVVSNESSPSSSSKAKVTSVVLRAGFD